MVKPMNGLELRPACAADALRVEAFNQRLAAAGETYHRLSLERPFRTMEHRADAPIISERYLCLDGDEVRGGIGVKRATFRIHQRLEEVAYSVYPLSESIVNRAYIGVGTRMLDELLQKHPLMYALGRAPISITNLRKRTGWQTLPVPFHFRVLRAFPFLRNINHLRHGKWRKLLLDILAYSGAGVISLSLLQSFQRLRNQLPFLKDVKVDRCDDWGDWADEIWKSAQDSYSLIGDRSKAALKTLYPDRHQHLTKLCFTESATNRPKGWAVLSISRLKHHKYFGNMVVAAIIDMLAVPHDAYMVASGAILAAQQSNADLVIVNHSDHRWNAAFQRAGMFPGKPNLFLSLSPRLTDLCQPIDEYAGRFFFTRGDGHGPTSLWLADYRSQ